MGHWEFNKADPSSVRIEVTQRDQFNNDDVGLADALVREAIQNSSDAGVGAGPVKVRFSIRTVTGSEAKATATQLGVLRPHLGECGVDTSALDADSFRVLAIEDFSTRGLTGSFEQVDGGNFDRFWRAVGDSGKSGKEGGRWGLGKLVYSSASMIKVFYGMSVSAGHPTPFLLGQVVLKNHWLGDTLHPAHGFYFADRSPPPLRLQLPIQDAAEIQKFQTLANLVRTNQTGLSLVIPYLLDGIDEASIISGVISNYYFPILAGRLSVEVGNVQISKDTFLEVAETHQAADHIPFDFIKEISDTIASAPEIVATQPIGNSELSASHFSPDTVARMKERFANDELVRVRLPVTLKPKIGADVTSYVDLYVRALKEGARPFALVARGPITLPGERRHFASAAAFGALVASDEAVSAFLGDAENPAHTAWNPKAEKLAPGWRNPRPTLLAIRRSLHQFYALVAEQAETEDSEALIDIFHILEKQAGAGKRKKSQKPKIKITPRERAISIKPRKGGFDIVAGPAAATWSFPRTIRVRVAYDMIGANPFKRHSPFDFDLEKGDGIEIEASSASCEAIRPNILKVTAESGDFHIQVSGFDERRDIVVDARAL